MITFAALESFTNSEQSQTALFPGKAKIQPSLPPPIPGSHWCWPGWCPTPVLVVLAFSISVAFLDLAVRWQLPLPKCGLRTLTGLPCPSCGCTRSLAAWANLDFEQAFRFNPLFFCVCVALIFWAGISGLERLSGQTLLSSNSRRFRQWPVWKIGIVLAAMNWLYLCLTLPK